MTPPAPDPEAAWTKQCFRVLYESGLVEWDAENVQWLPVLQGRRLAPGTMLMVGENAAVTLASTLLTQYHAALAEAQKAVHLMNGGSIQ